MHLKIRVFIFMQVKGLFKIIWQNVLYLSQNQAEMSAVFLSVVNFACPARYYSVLEGCYLSCMRRRLQIGEVWRSAF